MTDKLKAYRDSLSQEQKDALLKQAQAARIANITERDANAHLLKTEYLDSNHWASLASEYKIRMPHRAVGLSSKIVRKYLKKCGISIELFNEHYTSTSYFISNNPKYTAFAFIGLLLELKEEYGKTD